MELYFLSSYLTFEPFIRIFSYDKNSVVFLMRDNYAMKQLLDDLFDTNNYNQVLLDSYNFLNIRRPNFKKSSPNRYFEESLVRFSEFISYEQLNVHFFDDTFTLEFFIIINELLKNKNNKVFFYGNQYNISRYFKPSLKYIIIKAVSTFYFRIYGVNIVYFWNGYSIQSQWKHYLPLTETILENNYYNYKYLARTYVLNSDKKKILYLHSSIDFSSYLDHHETHKKVSDFLLKKLENSNYELYFKNHPHFDFVPLEFRTLLTKAILVPSHLHPIIIKDEFEEIFTLSSTAIRHFDIEKSFILESMLVYNQTNSTTEDYLEKNFVGIKRI